jgi:multidrug efflux pump
VAFLGGTTGVLYKQFAITIAISVGISSFVALTLTPALAAILLKPASTPGRFFTMFNNWMERMTNRYVGGVKLAIRRGGLALAALAAMLISIYVLFTVIPGSFVPAEDQGFLFAAVMLPDGASLDRSEEMTNEVANIFAEHPAVEDASALSGFSIIDGQFKTNTGTVFVSLKDFSERTDPSLSVNALIAYVTPKMRGFPGRVRILVTKSRAGWCCPSRRNYTQIDGKGR